MAEVTLGGERLGSGKKNKIHLRNYERSTHDLGYMWRSSMATGTLVPFLSEVALPGDTFDIDLDVDVKTTPTVGPLFGSYKVQLDVFQIPIRLYQGKLHMNMLNIGMDMKNVKLPIINLSGRQGGDMTNLDNLQVNPSCLLAYLGIRGVGVNTMNEIDAPTTMNRNFNAIPLLAYWDIYKNYYANKQEEKGAVISNPMLLDNGGIGEIEGFVTTPSGDTYTWSKQVPEEYTPSPTIYALQGNSLTIAFPTSDEPQAVDLGRIEFRIGTGLPGVNEHWVNALNLCTNWTYNNNTDLWTGTGIQKPPQGGTLLIIRGTRVESVQGNLLDNEPRVKFFDLENIDTMRKNILAHVTQNTPFMVNAQNIEPYKLLNRIGYDNTAGNDIPYFATQFSQEGLALKTYQSDMFNNWVSTEWIDGVNGVNEITKITVEQGAFTIDEFILSKKVYDMLNRIAVSGGSYDDWLDATYTHERIRSAENPMYQGGLIREIGFQEVISNAATEEQPLGTLGGRGVLSNKRKGGYIKIRVDEPSYIMGIVSITPRVDYSQGNKWDMNLRTLDDLHKPALDGIGFQDLITDQMAYWDTAMNIIGANMIPSFRSAGKQPAWLNYMTNVNRTYGNFAIKEKEMFMTLNRNYEYGIDWENNGRPYIKDLTTYIDPKKFNNIFAYTKRDAQNFWTQIHCGITARRKMSAKIIPNL